MNDDELASIGRVFLPVVAKTVEALVAFAHQLELLQANTYGTLRSRGAPHWLARFIAHRWAWWVK